MFLVQKSTVSFDPKAPMQQHVYTEKHRIISLCPHDLTAMMALTSRFSFEHFLFCFFKLQAQHVTAVKVVHFVKMARVASVTRPRTAANVQQISLEHSVSLRWICALQ